ncbi:S24 family peptidase [Deinococcus arenicola]|uniref:Peptidase S24/S26A/S26B/S26C domain-containing protein n=1 Tax=Deinococcus arenicola TaxID=2994950 RepID=A0ABU4DPG5_9DEIO|nr:S24 family peptidase [Deinococcus sp. ZS9-10]MDV6373994.1 hypothetical protein [Deinococcus sp. ZS9-10]
MSWAKHAKEKLSAGETVVIRPRGHSMTGKVNDGDTVTLLPMPGGGLGSGDIVLVRVKGADYLHLVKAISEDRVLIGNNRGGMNGWTRRKNIFGKAVKVER